MSPFCELLVVLRNLHTTFIYVFNAAFARLYSHGPEVSMAFPSPTLHKLWYTQFLSHLVPFSSATAASKNLPEKKKHISPSSSLTCNMKRTAAKLYLFLIIKRYLYRITFTICVLAGGRASRDAEQEQREGSKKYHCDIYANAIYYKRI